MNFSNRSGATHNKIRFECKGQKDPVLYGMVQWISAHLDTSCLWIPKLSWVALFFEDKAFGICILTAEILECPERNPSTEENKDEVVQVDVSELGHWLETHLCIGTFLLLSAEAGCNAQAQGFGVDEHSQPPPSTTRARNKGRQVNIMVTCLFLILQSSCICKSQMALGLRASCQGGSVGPQYGHIVLTSRR